MVKVIETNISLSPSREMADFQSRVIEVESWQSFIDEVKNKQPVERKSFMGRLNGLTIPVKCNVLNFVEINEYHFKCSVVHYDGRETLKLAYLIGKSEEELK